MPLPNPITALTQQDFLDLMDRLLPDHYLEPLKNGVGYEALQAFAAMAAAMSKGAEDLGKDSFALSADDGAYATGQVELYRDGLPTVGDPLPGQAGVAASIVAGAPGGEMRVTGLTNMSAASVGRYLVISNTAAPLNTGGFRITTYNSTSSVDVLNASATIPDLNNGTISWAEETRDLVVRSGTVVMTSRSGRDFMTQADVAFVSTALGPFTVAVRAAAKGYEYNVLGQATAADGELLAGEIDTVKTLVEDPVLLDTSIKVRQIAATSGGEDASLDAIGLDRGIERPAGEGIDSYRQRVRTLPDTVSPLAIYRTVLDMIQRINGVFVIIETFDIAYQTCYDGPSNQIAGSAYNPNLCAYDFPYLDNFRSRWLDTNDYRGGTIIVVDPIQPLAQYGMAFDDIAVYPADLNSTVSGGTRAVGAFDVSATYAFSLQGAYDGDDYEKNALFIGLFAVLQSIKPAGASIAIELRGE
jgi:hypothetical protein